ncbi:MAG: response regulator [Rhodospirillaceae bacterium]|jgi:DNA-binding response OmpR family regulator|nr:response regulator [Rhodospirillaceae bacterium]
MATILIIDDDKDVCESLAEALELFDHDCEVAYSGEAGIALAKSNRYDAAVVDFGLPGLSGVETIRALRVEHQDLHCILVTGYLSEQIEEQGTQSGASAIISKPFKLATLQDAIQAVKARS